MPETGKAAKILEASKKSIIASLLVYLATVILPLGDLGGFVSAFLIFPVLCAYAGYVATKKLKLGMLEGILAGLAVAAATEILTFVPQIILEGIGHLPPDTLLVLSSGDVLTLLIYWSIEAAIGIFFGAVGAFIGRSARGD